MVTVDVNVPRGSRELQSGEIAVYEQVRRVMEVIATREQQVAQAGAAIEHTVSARTEHVGRSQFQFGADA